MEGKPGLLDRWEGRASVQLAHFSSSLMDFGAQVALVLYTAAEICNFVLPTSAVELQLVAQFLKILCFAYQKELVSEGALGV